MRFKLTRELCYLAGATSGVETPESSIVGIRTSSDGVLERFVKYAITLGVEPRKIMVDEKEGVKGVYFYHSKLARQMREVLRERGTLPRRNKEMAVCLIAGMFDLKGRVTDRGISMGRLDKADTLMLELLGIHTRDTNIMNISAFVSLIRGESLIAAGFGARKREKHI